MSLGEPCRVVLVGMMGTGKTTVGRVLADRTGWTHHDNDDLLLRLTGMTPRQLLESAGETGLRRAESQALALAFASPPPSIVGAAAGTILDAADRHLIERSGVVVWLQASTATVERRASGAAHRAWLDREGWVAAAVAERDPLYESVADLVVDTDAHNPSEVAEAVLDRIGVLEACAQWLLPVAT